eukprot:TRINITY_DN47830_c0_g1_i2.p1 TRINITY_DN47830_c0_g1~~TRINITY_DN47830_c0_g1_i2.p1  ORF type:complete len:173 (-),score=47.41 TRINITY_DN47830_c0_g1_i2:126-644(-)
MSGVGRTHRGKHITQTCDQIDGLLNASENLKIAQVTATRGNNIFSIRFPDGTEELTTLPRKFHKILWIQRGNFVVVDVPPEAKSGDTVNTQKVRTTISIILTPNAIKQLKAAGEWPAEFADESKAATSPSKEETTQDDGSDEEEEEEEFVNPNRANNNWYDGDESEEEDDED